MATGFVDTDNIGMGERNIGASERAIGADGSMIGKMSPPKAFVGASMHKGGVVRRTGFYKLQAGERVIPKRGNMAGNRWMQGVKRSIKHRGTEGVFSGAAHRHGESTHAYAEEKKHSPGKVGVGKRARLALAFESARHKK